MKKAVSLLLTLIFAMSLSTSVYANEVKSTEQIPSSEYSSEIKSAEQSVLDFFEAIQKKDYYTLNRVSMNKLMSEDVLRNTIDMQHKTGMIAEKPPTILSSEMYGEDMVNVKVSYVLDGEEHIMTYPVVLVNNEWIVNVCDAVNPVEDVRYGDVILLEDIVYEINSATSGTRWVYSQKNMNAGGLVYRFLFSYQNYNHEVTVQGWQDCPSNPNNFSASYNIAYLNAYNQWMATGKPSSHLIWNGGKDDWWYPQTFTVSIQ